MANAAKSATRTRWIFSAEFKQEAVRRLAERQAQGISVERIGRELMVRPETLRLWKHQLAAQGEAALTDVFPGQGRLPSDQEALRRFDREVRRLAQENAFPESAAAYFGTNGSDFFRYNGTSFTPMALPSGISAIYGLWGSGPTQVFAVDFSGSVIRFDGTQWITLRVPRESNNFNALHGVATRLFTVGSGGAVMVTR